MDSARREADLGEGAFCVVHEVREPGDVVGDVLLPAVAAVAVDRDFAPAFVSMMKTPALPTTIMST